MEILIRNQQRKIRISMDYIRELAGKIMLNLGLDTSELSLLLVNNPRIRALNREYRGINEPTDVLAFPMQEGEFKGLNQALLGDLVISLERALRQAKEGGHPLERELAILIIHGLLHLMGYDHERGGHEEKRMKKKERELLKKVDLE